jgi:hypothetical protein
MATFVPVALTIDFPEGRPETAAQALWTSGSADLYSSRVLFHEAIHYWQLFSQSFLLRLVAEDWHRLIEYERTGQRTVYGSIRQEFHRQEPALGFSASELHECLARFWEIVAFGPNRVMRDQWLSGRAVFHPDFITANRPAAFQRLSEGAGPWGHVDFVEAMMMVGGEYAVPFLATGRSMGDAAIFVFPWLAHYAFQTRHPATLFARFVESSAAELASEAREMLRGAAGAQSHAFTATMVNMATSALRRCRPIASSSGEDIGPALATYASCHLPTSPLVSWTIERRILPTVTQLMQSEDAFAAATRSGDRSTKGKFFAAVGLLERATATPGLMDSRNLLLIAGLAPPCVRFSDGQTVSMAQQYRRDACRARDVLRGIDLVTNLLPFARDAARDQEDAYTRRLSEETRSRWRSFVDSSTTDLVRTRGDSREGGATHHGELM